STRGRRRPSGSSRAGAAARCAPPPRHAPPPSPARCARPGARPSARRLRPPPGRMRRGRTVTGAASRGDRGASWTPARGEGDGGGRVLRAPAAVPSPPQQEGQEAQADDHGDLYEGIVEPDAARLPAGEGAGGDE